MREWLPFEDEYLRSSRDPISVKAERLSSSAMSVTRRMRKIGIVQASPIKTTERAEIISARRGELKVLAKTLGRSYQAIRRARSRMIKAEMISVADRESWVSS